MLQRQQGSYILTVEAGRQLLLSADSRAEVALQAELTDIQERWKNASISLDEQKKELATVLKVYEQHVVHRKLLDCLKTKCKCVFEHIQEIQMQLLFVVICVYVYNIVTGLGEV